jgi:hypothetical protein
VRTGIALGLCALCAAPAPALGYFEEVAVGARGISMGPAAMSLVTDVSSFYWNPAALAELRRPEVLLDYAKPFGLEDVNEGSVAAGARYAGIGWAAAWHRLALTDVYGEDLFMLAAGREVLRWGGGHALAGGAAFKLGRIGFQPFADPGTGATVDLGSLAKGSLDVGLRWTTPWRVDLAYVVRDILEPRYELVRGSGGDLQNARQEVGAAIHWNRESTITVGWSSLDAEETVINAAIEILFFEVFAIRSGVSNLSRIYQSYGSPAELQYNGGFGIFHHGYFIDAAATTNRDLGASYRVTLRVPLGRTGEP